MFDHMYASRWRILRTRLGSNPRIRPFADGFDVPSMQFSRFNSYHRTPFHRVEDHISERIRDNATDRKSILVRLARYDADPGQKNAF